LLFLEIAYPNLLGKKGYVVVVVVVVVALPRNEKHKCIYIAEQSLFAISSNIMGTALLMRKNNWNSMLHDKVGLGIARTTCLSPSFWKL